MPPEWKVTHRQTNTMTTVTLAHALRVNYVTTSTGINLLYESVMVDLGQHTTVDPRLSGTSIIRHHFRDCANYNHSFVNVLINYAAALLIVR